MPPVTKPVPQLILESLQAALALPNSGADYFNTFTVVKIGEDILQASTLPAVTIGIGELGRMYQSKDGQVIWQTAFKWSLSVIAAIEGTENAAFRLLQVLHDVHKAVMQDDRRGGVALTTFVTDCALLPPIDESDTRSWIEVAVEVHFRFQLKDMLTAA